MKGSLLKRFDLNGRIAVVTGASGILGRVFGRVLVEAGARVALVDIDGKGCASLAARLCRLRRSSAMAVPCDVSDERSVERMAETVTRTWGRIDVLHNNAASKSSDLESFFAPYERYALKEWRSVMAVNLDGMFLVSKVVGERMKRRRSGSIVQTASIYGLMAPDQRIYEGSWYLGRPINSPAVYAASKAGVLGLTRYLAAYWAKDGIRVNALVPGGVESGQNAEFKRRYSARVPLGRMARAEEMAGALLYLASDASSYVTGQAVVVDGGLSAW